MPPAADNREPPGLLPRDEVYSRAEHEVSQYPLHRAPRSAVKGIAPGVGGALRMRSQMRVSAVLASCCFTCIAASAWANDMPARKPGLWEVSMHMDTANAPTEVTKLCLDAATDAAMQGLASTSSSCSKKEMRRDGDVVTSNSVCKFGGTEMTSQAVATFSGDTAYHVEIKTQYKPPMMGRGESTMTQDAKWVGACPADMRPGDVIAPNGMRMNMMER